MAQLLENFRKKSRLFSEELAEIRFSAAGLAFSTLLSLIPFLVVILTVFQSIGGLEAFYPRVESLLLESMKEATGATVTKYLKTTINQAQSRTVGYTGVAFLIFSTIGLLRNIDIAFHRLWKIKPQKPFIRRLWIHALVLLSLPVLLAIYIGLKSIDIIENLSQGYHDNFFSYVLMTLLLWSLYKFVPNTKVSRLSSFISSLLASLALLVVQKSFFWISLKVFRHNKIFGSLASFPIFMMWLLVVWTIILAGTSLCNHLMQKKSAK